MDKKLMWLGAAFAAVISLITFAWKTAMAEELIWMGAFIACIALPAWAMVLSDDNAES